MISRANLTKPMLLLQVFLTRVSVNKWNKTNKHKLFAILAENLSEERTNAKYKKHKKMKKERKKEKRTKVKKQTKLRKKR